MADLNEIVDHYKVHADRPEWELKTLKAMLKDVPISLARLQMEVEDICKPESIGTVLDIRAELYQPDTRILLLDELLVVRDDEDSLQVADEITERMLLP